MRLFLENPEDGDAKKQLQDWMLKYTSAYQYTQVALFDAHGFLRVLALEGDKLVDLRISHNVEAILREDRVVFQDFHRETPDGHIHLGVLVPIFDEADENLPLGVLLMEVDPTTYLYPFISRWPTPTQTAETFLARRDGDDILFLNELKFDRNAALNLRIPLTRTDLPIVKAALGHRGVVEGVDYRGKEVVAAVGAVPDSPWYLVARMDIAEAYAPLKERIWQMVALVSVLLIGSGFFLGFIWRRRSARFYKERYEAAEELKKAEEKFHLYIDSISDAIWVLDTDRKVTYVSSSVSRIIGYAPEELTGKPSMDFIHPDDLSLVANTQSRVVERPGHPANLQYRMIHKNGSSVHVETTGVSMIDNPSVHGVIITMRDVTKRKRAEEDLQKFFNLVPDMVCVASTDGHFLKINPSWEKTLGFSEYEILSTPFHDFIHPDDRETTMKEVAEQIGVETAIMFTNRYRCRDGSYKWLEWNATPSDDRKLLFVAARDITERKLGEIELCQAKEKAEAATKLKDQFVELVAHDLKSPFSSMMGLIKLFADRHPAIEDDINQKILERVMASGDRMISMIDELLKINRLQSGKITPQPRFFNGRMAVSATIGSLAHNAAQKGIEVINEVSVDMRLYADQSLFNEVLLNLLSNAIKFCSRGDTITFFTPPGENAIAVRDTGKGIKDSALPNLFKHEVVTSTPGTAGEMGTGFGLPFSNDIIKAHGGEITVESAPGKGSVFCVALPYVKPVALVVEDDSLALMALKGHLEVFGIDVIAALDGERALEALKDKRPHIIITDLSMPGMDGFTLLDRLKQDASTSAIPVIVMTGADAEVKDNVFRHGAEDFVGKPLMLGDFIPRVRRIVG